ncbi:MAG: arylsulfatase [Aureliella sp.]
MKKICFQANPLPSKLVHTQANQALIGLVLAVCLGTNTSTWGANPVVQPLGDQQSSPRPNIIIVLVDDMGFSDIGCYGSEIETPNLDQLAANGLRFTQFYNSGRCCPTRASLMTGLHPHQVGIGHMTEPPERPLGFEGAYQGHLNDQCATLASVLGGAGYKTMMVGKWHLGYHLQSDWPMQRGFERFFGSLSGAFNYFQPDGTRGLQNGNQPIVAEDDFYATDTFTDIACDYISDTCKSGNEPFFLYLAYNAPHWPLNTKLDEFNKYKGKYSDGWDAMMKRRQAKQLEIGLFEGEIAPAPHDGPAWDSLSEEKRDEMDSIQAAYAGCIDSIDQNIGKLQRHLGDLNELENTLIFFLSDNGACQEGGMLGKFEPEWVENPPSGVGGIRQGQAWANASNTPFRLFKHFVHEGGACTPLIAHWPGGIPKDRQGTFVREFGYLPDFMATCVDLAGAEYPASIPMHVGQSLAPALRGEKGPIHQEPIFWEHEGNAAMRDGDWKLVREYQKPWELFNIGSDRTEMNNLATSNPQKRDELVGKWTAWAKEHEVAFPERFNMYQYLNKLKKEEKKQSSQGSK